jgi:hypothetical protein
MNSAKVAFFSIRDDESIVGYALQTLLIQPVT